MKCAQKEDYTETRREEPVLCWQPEPFSKVISRICLSFTLFRKVIQQGHSEGACEA